MDFASPLFFRRLGRAFGAALFLLVTSFSGANAQDLPPPVDRALQEAEANADLRLSYTMAFRWLIDGAVDKRVVARFDAVSEEWTFLDGALEDLSHRARKKFRTYQRLESKPGGLVYAEYRPFLADVTPTLETDQHRAYSFRSAQPPASIAERGPVDTTLIVSKTHGGIERYAIKTTAPFKPNAASRLDDFVFEQTFERAAPDSPPLMTRLYWRLKGTRLLAILDEEFDIEFYDFRIVR